MCLPLVQNGLRLHYAKLAKRAHDALTALDHSALERLLVRILKDPTGLPSIPANGHRLYVASGSGIYILYHLIEKVVLVTFVTSHRGWGDGDWAALAKRTYASRAVLETMFGDLLNCGDMIRVRPRLYRFDPDECGLTSYSAAILARFESANTGGPATAPVFGMATERDPPATS